MCSRDKVSRLSFDASLDLQAGMVGQLSVIKHPGKVCVCDVRDVRDVLFSRPLRRMLVLG